ncbi:hypothetical protein DDT52_00590 [Brenneria roseae subsp. roseae]|uniref:hypothetical protein n=1 Tax=Brenneria roseae TaxID=1509241 RepID=UPI000D61F709|nr:hypothetical protein [Brenneria roseae]PWC22803.1 hypothetical protein DDT52_00590 [Brenneria roseae subsp. roseae]
MEQIERSKRYLTRMEKIYSGIFSSSDHDKEGYDDDVISFFIHCYHIRDWFIHLNRLNINASQVDIFINKHQALKICADLANGSKHCNLTRSLRTGRQPHIAGKQKETSTWLTGSGSGKVMKCKYTILCNNTLYDALQLARECIQLWDSYISEIKTIKKEEIDSISDNTL